MQRKCYFPLKSMLFLIVLALIGTHPVHAQGAAPSEHLNFYFPSDAVLKMHKIKITQTDFASYFEINSFTRGYAGLQHTSDSSQGSSHTLISSVWDPNTAGGIYSQVDYKAPNTFTGRFGGEGDGYKSINPYNWVLNTWYNQVIRSWKSNGRLYIATFIQNLSTNIWFHTATQSIPDQPGYLGKNNDAFLENWINTGAKVRKAFFKDCWNLNTTGSWEKHTSRNFSANAGDSVRNGIYDRAFNSGYDATEDAYFMQHGGNTTPDAAFGTGRTLNLPPQTGQGLMPALTTGEITAVSAIYNNHKAVINWTINQQKSPQLSAQVQILDSHQSVVATFIDTLPQRRSDTMDIQLTAGEYTAKVTITDIFNQQSIPVTSNFSVGSSIAAGYYYIKNASSGKYLAIEDSAIDNLKNIVQYTGSNSNAFQWQLQQIGNAYSLINKKSTKAIDLPAGQQTSGTEPIQYQATSGANQQWNLIPVATSTYLIQSNLSNHFVLDDPGASTAEGTHIIIYAANGSSGSINQHWILEPVNTNQSTTTLTVELAKAANSTAFKVWPNPVGNTLHVQIENAHTNENKADVLIYNSTGKLTKRISPGATGSSIKANVSGLPAGIYYLVQGTAQTIFIKK